MPQNGPIRFHIPIFKTGHATEMTLQAESSKIFHFERIEIDGK
jgi:hypothetical protein